MGFRRVLHCPRNEDWRAPHRMPPPKEPSSLAYPMASIDLETLRLEGGWASLRMVERYATVSAGHRTEAMRRLGTKWALADKKVETC
jgi:hypothetical protein